MTLIQDERAEAELGAPLLGLWHRAEELSSRGLDFHGVVSELVRSMEEGRRERDVPPPKNQGQLSVLTLHASKGLEFPHVILLDLPPKPPRAQAAPLLFWDREKGAFLMPRDADGERDTSSPEVLAWKRMEESKNLAESKRLFYVALTRARERLVLVTEELPEPVKAPSAAPAKKRASAEKEPVDPRTQDFWWGWIDAARLELPSAAPSVGPAVPAEGSNGRPGVEASLARAPAWPKPVPQRPRHSVTEWTTLSRCPRAYEWTYVRPVVMAEGIVETRTFTGERVERFSETELSQRELGTRVHGCLEKGDYDGLRRLEQEAGSQRFQAEPVISWALSSDWMAPPAPGRDVWAEIAFEVPVGREPLVGSIDRLVRVSSERREARPGTRSSISK